MKSLQTYIEKEQTEIFDKYGAFFAFSKENYDKNAKQDVGYIGLGSGLVAPRINAQKIIEELDAGYKKGIQERIEEYGIDRIIQYELSNYECQLSMDYSDAFDTLKDYGVTQEQMDEQFSLFMEYCRENDLF